MTFIPSFIFAPPSDDGKYRESLCALHIDMNEGPQIHIFDIQENKGAVATQNILGVAMAVRDAFLPLHGLKDIKWQLVKGAIKTPVQFYEQNGLCYRIDFKDSGPNEGILFNRLTTNPLSEYLEKSKQKGIKETFAQSSSLYRGGLLSIYPVHVPQDEAAYIYLRQVYTSPHMRDGWKVVIADAQKVLELWRSQTKDLETTLKNLGLTWKKAIETEWTTGEDPILLNMSLASSLENLRGHRLTVKHELPHLNYRPEFDMPLSHTNGRHRLFNMINCGAPFVPLEMEATANTELFKERFGWRTFSNSITPQKPAIFYPKYERQ